MVSVVAGAVVNAVAFAGAGFLFSKFNHSGYSSEMKRHDKAMENLEAAKEKWHEAEQRKYDQIKKRREELSDSNADINATNKALDEYKRTMNRIHIIHDRIRFNEEPRLDQFYKTFEEMKKYKFLFVLILIVASVLGIILSKLL